MIIARPAKPAELPAARNVWRKANIARGKSPDAARIHRVDRKLADPAAVVLVALDGTVIVGMTLAEPGRAADGAGPELPELWHVSMVFVDPDHWGRRIGVVLLDELAARAGAAGKHRLQLWTGQANERAQRLYRRAGFVASGRMIEHAGEPVIHLERSVSVPVVGIAPRVRAADEEPGQAPDERREQHHHEPDQLHPGRLR